MPVFEVDRLHSALNIIAGAPDNLKYYSQEFHLAVCRAVANAALKGCHVDFGSNGAVVYKYVPEELLEEERELEDSAWRKQCLSS